MPVNTRIPDSSEGVTIMKGIYSALMGVFSPDGTVNEAGLRALVRHNIEACRVDGLYVNGSTGEPFLMTQKMRLRVLKIVADEAKGKAKLIAHVGSLSLDDSNEQSAYAAELGYDAVSAVTPFYYKFTADEICMYYRDIAAKSALPVLAYYIPHLSGVTMNEAGLSRILDIPGIVGMKFTSNDFYALERIRSARPDKLLLSGFDEMLLPATVLGTDGAIGSTYNVMGHWAKKLFRLAQAGDIGAARDVQRHMNHLIAEIVDNGQFGTLKAVCQLYGIDAGEPKPPMAPISQKQRAAAERIKDYLEKTQI